MKLNVLRSAISYGDQSTTTRKGIRG
jgi:hypothetical protein